MKKIFFVRHGVSVANDENKFAGQLETPLTDKGRLQAIDAGKKLQASGHVFDLIITSPLQRAIHTAEHIASELSYPLADIEINDLAIERSWGIHEDRSIADFLKEHPIESLDAMEGVETLENTCKRAEKFLTYLQSKEKENILVVSHGSFGEVLAGIVQGHAFGSQYFKEPITIANCEIIELI